MKYTCSGNWENQILERHLIDIRTPDGALKAFFNNFFSLFVYYIARRIKHKNMTHKLINLFYFYNRKGAYK